jgi:hypothetical protein
VTSTENDSTLESSIPTAPLESILCTEELQRRPSRPPDYKKENRALVKLVSALADSPRTIFQTLAETIRDITQCDSAGLSLLTKDGKTPNVDGQRFYWPAISGMWNPHVGGGTPRNFGPFGDVLDQNRTLLFTHFERRYPYLMPVNPAAENASTCQRMLATEPPNIGGALETSRRTIRDANRASEVIARLRALFNRKETATESVDLNETTGEVIALSLSGLQRNGVVVRTELADKLPRVTGASSFSRSS